MPSTRVMDTEITVISTVTHSACHQYGEVSTAP